MQNSFIFGLGSSVKNSSIYDTETLYKATGQNSGNLAFHYAIEQMLRISDPSAGWKSTQSVLNKKSGIAIMPCANQLGAHANYGWLAKTVTHLPETAIALGLGAQSGTSCKIPDVPQGSRDWIQAMFDKSASEKPNVGVRGEFTLKVLEHYGVSEKAEVLGCPTLFINPDKELGHKIAAKMDKFPERVAVPGGHQKWQHLSKIEQCLASIVTETNGSYTN